MELDPSYVAGSALRFMEHMPEAKVLDTFQKLTKRSGRLPIDLSAPPSLFDLPRASGTGV